MPAINGAELRGYPNKLTADGRVYAGLLYVKGKGVCDDGWVTGGGGRTTKNANVACRMLGFDRALNLAHGLKKGELFLLCFSEF